MAEYNVEMNSNQIDFGASGVNEIIQNVRMILTTPQFSCPLDRGFAWDHGLLDSPNNVVQAKLSAKIVAAIKKYEPRAKVVKVSYQGDLKTGKLKPVVRVSIDDYEI